MKESTPDEAQFRTKLTELIHAFLAHRHPGVEGAITRVERRESFEKLGVNGFFDYVKKVGSRYLILELKIQRNGKLPSYCANQHLVLNAIEQCRVPIRYAWNSEEIRKLVLLPGDGALSATSTTPASQLYSANLVEDINLKEHLKNLLPGGQGAQNMESCFEALRFAQIFAGDNQNFNAAAFLISVNLDDLKFSVDELNADFVAQIKAGIEQIQLPASWKSQSVEKLANELDSLFLAAISQAPPPAEEDVMRTNRPKI